MRRCIGIFAAALAGVAVTVSTTGLITNALGLWGGSETPASAIAASETRPSPPGLTLPAVSPVQSATYLSAKAASPSPSASPKEGDDYIEVASVPDGDKKSLGEFTVTAYCSCSKCCGKWSGHKMSIPTQAGVPYPVEGYTISVDPKVIPLKSVVELEGYGTRYAHDTGSGIKGKRIDIYFASHEDALAFGKRKLEVWIYE